MRCSTPVLRLSVRSFSRPLVSPAALSYTTPTWGKNKVLRAALGDWTIGTVLQYASGQPIPVAGTATSNLAGALLRGTHAERVAGQPLFLQDLNCHCFDPATTQVLNPKAWTDPIAGTFANSAYYYGDYRYQRRPRESLSLGRIFRVREKVRLTVCGEFTNPFNRTQTPNPVNPGGSYASNLATVTGANGLKVNNSGFGAIATQPALAISGERSGLLTARIQF